MHHARARLIDATVSAQAGQIVLRVTDNGCGLNAPADDLHYGLLSIVERAERLGGQVTVTSDPNAGTVIVAQLPIPAPA